MFKFRIKRSRLASVAGIYALGGMAALAYAIQIQYTNSYAGFLPIDYSVMKISVMILLGAAIGLSVPSNVSRPSDLFIIIYAVFVLVSFVFFRGVAVDTNNLDYFFQMGVLSFPYIGALMLQRLRWTINSPFSINSDALLLIVILIVAFAALVSIDRIGSVGSLSIENVYERRIAGRQIFQVGSLVSYLLVMAMNGLNPFIAFLAGFLNRKWIFALSFVFSLTFFYSVGVKAPIAMVFLSFIAGILARRGGIGQIFTSIIYICAALFVAFIMEYVATGYSQVAEYFFRRAFVIPGFLVQYYMLFMFDSHGVFWSAWSGLNDSTLVTFVIGDEFLGNAQANANTNAFVYALAGGGYPVYVAIVAFVLAFFKVLDALYEGTNNSGFLYIAFLYSLLIAEQAATTAALSSGVALLFCFVLLSGKEWVRAPRRV